MPNEIPGPTPIEMEGTGREALVSLYSHEEEQFLRGVEILQKAGDDKDQLGLAFLKFYLVAERICDKYLRTFRPLIGFQETAHLFNNSDFMSRFLKQHWFVYQQLGLIGEVEHNVLSSFSEDRNKFVHEGKLSISPNNVKAFGGVVKSLLISIRNRSAKDWGKLVGMGLNRESEEQVRRVLTNDILDALDSQDWIKQVVPGLEGWAFPFMENEPESFFPKLPIQISDIVVTDREEVSPEDPADILLFERTLLSQDLGMLTKKTEKLLGYPFPVVFFVPVREKDKFIEKLLPLGSNIHLITYDYDPEGKIHLRYLNLSHPE